MATKVYNLSRCGCCSGGCNKCNPGTTPATATAVVSALTGNWAVANGTYNLVLSNDPAHLATDPTCFLGSNRRSVTTTVRDAFGASHSQTFNLVFALNLSTGVSNKINAFIYSEYAADAMMSWINTTFTMPANCRTALNGVAMSLDFIKTGNLDMPFGSTSSPSVAIAIP